MFLWVRLTEHFTFADDIMLMVIEIVMVFVKTHNYVFCCVNCNYGYGTVSPFLTHLTPSLPPTTNSPFYRQLKFLKISRKFSINKISKTFE